MFSQNRYFNCLIWAVLTLTLLGLASESDLRLFKSGQLSLEEKDYPKAIKIFSEVIENVGSNELGGLAGFKLGECYAQTGEHRKALAEFQKVYDNYESAGGEWYLALVSVAGCYLKLSEYEKAIDCYQKILLKYPETNRRAEIYLGLAVCYKQFGKEAEAKASLDNIVREFPGSAHARRANYLRSFFSISANDFKAVFSEDFQKSLKANVMQEVDEVTEARALISDQGVVFISTHSTLKKISGKNPRCYNDVIQIATGTTGLFQDEVVFNLYGEEIWRYSSPFSFEVSPDQSYLVTHATAAAPGLFLVRKNDRKAIPNLPVSGQNDISFSADGNVFALLTAGKGPWLILLNRDGQETGRAQLSNPVGTPKLGPDGKYAVLLERESSQELALKIFDRKATLLKKHILKTAQQNCDLTVSKDNKAAVAVGKELYLFDVAHGDILYQTEIDPSLELNNLRVTGNADLSQVLVSGNSKGKAYLFHLMRSIPRIGYKIFSKEELYDGFGQPTARISSSGRFVLVISGTEIHSLDPKTFISRQ